MNTELPSKYIPQADSIGKILDILEALAAGPLDDQGLARVIGADRRQGTYYRLAAESVGLLDFTEGKAQLTDLGSMLANKLVERPEQMEFLRIAVLVNPVLRDIVGRLEKASKGGVPLKEIEQVLITAGHLSEVTARRRSRTVVGWLETLHLVRVSGQRLFLDRPLLDLR